MELMYGNQRNEFIKQMVLKKGCDLVIKDRFERMGVNESYEEYCGIEREKYYPLEEFASKLSRYEFFETEYVEGRMYVVKINTYLSIHKMMGEDSDFPEEYRIEVREIDGCLYVEKEKSEKTINWIDDMSQSGKHEYLHFVFGGVKNEGH